MAIFEMLTIRCSEVRWVELNETLVVGYYGLEEFTLLFRGFMHINFGLRNSYSALRGGFGKFLRSREVSELHDIFMIESL